MSLSEIIAAEISSRGPMPLNRYMALCLSHPEFGYYTTQDPLGKDFTTAPEISQMFGEMIGLWLADVWTRLGKPDIVLAELGPGRGTLMADALRMARKIPGFIESVDVHLLEGSPTLRKIQQGALSTIDPTWTARLSDLPNKPLLLVANEFFDALPIRQFQCVDTVFLERCIGYDQNAFRYIFVPTDTPPLKTLPDGAITETCPSVPGIVTEISAHIYAHGGAALILDYGSEAGDGDTFQALHRGQSVDPLTLQGQADLTAHVRFGDLIAATSLKTSLDTQGAFLERLGITEWARKLAAKDPAIIDQHRRLTHPEEMGTLFKVLGIASEGLTLPGFAP